MPEFTREGAFGVSAPGGLTMACRAMVASAHPIATSIGVDVLKRGGNAMDAALATAAATFVFLPETSGFGGDTFIIYYDAAEKRTYAINGSGAAPTRATLAEYRSRGFDASTGMPGSGPLSAAVYGSPDAMETAFRRFGSGRLTMAELVAPAAEYARRGFPVGLILAREMASQRAKLAADAESAATFLANGEPYRAGMVIKLPNLARTLELFASEGAEPFYRGEIARRVAELMAASGGLIGAPDLAAHRTDVLDPIGVRYRDLEVIASPPPSQGMILLEALGILNSFDLSGMSVDDPEAIHLAVEAKRLATADRNAWAGDPRHVDFPLERMLSPEYCASRAGEIDPGAAKCRPEPGDPRGDTTNLVAVDEAGNAVSYIHSISHPFGSGVTVPGTGIVLNNRAGRGFSLDPSSPNAIAPGKRTMHTLMAFMAMRGGAPYLVGNTMGGDGQPQYNIQLVTAVADFGLSVRDAVQSPRWIDLPATDPSELGAAPSLRIENRAVPETVEGLAALGHPVEVIGPWSAGGISQLIEVGEGALFGASDPRGEGICLGY